MTSPILMPLENMGLHVSVDDRGCLIIGGLKSLPPKTREYALALPILFSFGKMQKSGRARLESASLWRGSARRK